MIDTRPVGIMPHSAFMYVEYSLLGVMRGLVLATGEVLKMLLLSPFFVCKSRYMVLCPGEERQGPLKNDPRPLSLPLLR